MAALARETAGGVTVRAKFPRKLDFLLGKVSWMNIRGNSSVKGKKLFPTALSVSVHF